MRKNVRLALIFNILIVLMEVTSLTTSPILDSFKEMLYCNCANLLALVASLLMVIFILIKKEVNEVPFNVIVLRYMASVSLILVTLGLFILVIPTELGLSNYLAGISLYNKEFGKFLFHVLCPLLSLISFIFFEGDRRLNKKKTMYYPCLFTLVYALFTVVLVLTGKINSPYEFLKVNESPLLSCTLIIVIGIVNYLIARYTLLFNQIKAPRIKLKR